MTTKMDAYLLIQYYNRMQKARLYSGKRMNSWLGRNHTALQPWGMYHTGNYLHPIPTWNRYQ